jgi:hypothetical protein
MAVAVEGDDVTGVDGEARHSAFSSNDPFTLDRAARSYRGSACLDRSGAP